MDFSWVLIEVIEGFTFKNRLSVNIVMEEKNISYVLQHFQSIYLHKKCKKVFQPTNKPLIELFVFRSVRNMPVRNMRYLYFFLF